MISRLLITLTFFTFFFWGCSVKDGRSRAIRGHTNIQSGIAHGLSADHAERYCSHCHGAKLRGGIEAQPSCYRCHGQRWADVSATEVFAPLDTHNVSFKGYRHHEALDQVQTTCTGCHGLDLRGAGKTGPPSCFLCHEKIWQ